MKELEYGGDVYKQCPSWPDYYSSKDGRILSTKLKEPRPMRSCKTAAGYMQLSLSGPSKSVGVHRMVADAWLPKPNIEEKVCVNHKDLDKSNNNVDNLEWCSYSHNNRHWRRNKSTHRKGVIAVSVADGSALLLAQYRDAAHYGFNINSVSTALGNKRRNRLKGYDWYYAD